MNTEPSRSGYAVTVLVVDRATGTLYSTIWDAQAIRVAHASDGGPDRPPLATIVLLDASIVDSSINGE